MNIRLILNAARQLCFVGAAGTVLLSAPAARAQASSANDATSAVPETGRFTILEENDSLFFNSDKHYTQGLRGSYLFPPPTDGSPWYGPFDFLTTHTPVFQPDGSDAPDQRYAVFAGQSIFTPKNLTAKPPPTNDRPYGGWLYVGTSLLQDSGQLKAQDRSQLENFELDLGMVGPAALGEQVQNDFHQLIGARQAQGWSDQIQNEPGIDLSYERLWRLPLPGTDSVDLVPQMGATVGNVFTYGEVGGLLRIGRNLGADYGPVRIRPGLSGTDYFSAKRSDGGGGWYFYVGTQGRVVGRNIFLDGNSFRQSPSVQKKVLVGDIEAGVSAFWSSNARVDLSVVERSLEFVGQRAPDDICTFVLALSF